jgi:hypothetical protein
MEASMGRLIVRCPATGWGISSGVETDSRSFELTPAFTGTIHCPICRVDHQWSKADAWVCEIESAAQPARRPEGIARPSLRASNAERLRDLVHRQRG